MNSTSLSTNSNINVADLDLAAQKARADALWETGTFHVGNKTFAAIMSGDYSVMPASAEAKVRGFLQELVDEGWKYSAGQEEGQLALLRDRPAWTAINAERTKFQIGHDDQTRAFYRNHGKAGDDGMLPKFSVEDGKVQPIYQYQGGPEAEFEVAIFQAMHGQIQQAYDLERAFEDTLTKADLADKSYPDHWVAATPVFDFETPVPEIDFDAAFADDLQSEYDAEEREIAGFDGAEADRDYTADSSEVTFDFEAAGIAGRKEVMDQAVTRKFLQARNELAAKGMVLDRNDTEFSVYDAPVDSHGDSMVAAGAPAIAADIYTSTVLDRVIRVGHERAARNEAGATDYAVTYNPGFDDRMDFVVRTQHEPAHIAEWAGKSFAAPNVKVEPATAEQVAEAKATHVHRLSVGEAVIQNNLKPIAVWEAQKQREGGYEADIARRNEDFLARSTVSASQPATARQIAVLGDGAVEAVFKSRNPTADLERLAATSYFAEGNGYTAREVEADDVAFAEHIDASYDSLDELVAGGRLWTPEQVAEWKQEFGTEMQQAESGYGERPTARSVDPRVARLQEMKAAETAKPSTEEQSRGRAR